MRLTYPTRNSSEMASRTRPAQIDLEQPNYGGRPWLSSEIAALTIRISRENPPVQEVQEEVLKPE